MKNAPVYHAFEYAVFRTLATAIRLLPHAGARRLGTGLGWLAWVLDGHHRRIARENLERALPELSAAARRQLVRRCFQHFGLAFCDTLSARRFDLEELCRRLDLEGWEHLQEAEAASAGRGVFIMSAHLGLWEMAANPPGIYGGPLHVVGRPVDNPWLDRELVASRARFGNQLIPKQGAVRGMLKALGRGGRVGILIDQRAKPQEGIPVPFFGIPSTTTPSLAQLALRTGAPVVPIYGYPLPHGRYRVVLRPAIWPGEDSPAELTRRYLENVEQEIRRQPELWLWLHKRWKDVPRER